VRPVSQYLPSSANLLTRARLVPARSLRTRSTRSPTAARYFISIRECRPGSPVPRYPENSIAEPPIYLSSADKPARVYLKYVAIGVREPFRTMNETSGASLAMQRGASYNRVSRRRVRVIFILMSLCKSTAFISRGYRLFTRHSRDAKPLHVQGGFHVRT